MMQLQRAPSPGGLDAFQRCPGHGDTQRLSAAALGSVPIWAVPIRRACPPSSKRLGSSLEPSVTRWRDAASVVNQIHYINLVQHHVLDASSKFSITLCLKYLLILFWMRITDVGESNSWLLSFGDQGCPWSFRAIFATGRAVVTATQPQNHLLPAARSAKRSAPEVQLIEYVSFMFLTPTHAIHSMSVCVIPSNSTLNTFSAYTIHTCQTLKDKERAIERVARFPLFSIITHRIHVWYIY